MRETDPATGFRPYAARRIEVTVDGEGLPSEVGGRTVASVRESWLVEEGWWSTEPLRRQYFELVTGQGENLTVFLSIPEGAWFLQRA